MAKLRDYTHPVNLKEINPEFSLEGLLLKLKCQSFGYLMLRADSLEKKKTLLLGKIEGKRLRWQRMRSLDSTTDSTDMNMANSGRQQGTEEPSVLQSMGSQRDGHDLVTEQQH